MKWYQSMLAFLTGFFNLTAGSDEADVHAEMQETLGKYGSFANMKSTLRTEAETAVQEAHEQKIATLVAEHEQSILQLQESHQDALNTLQQQLDEANQEIATLREQPAAPRTPAQSAPTPEADDRKKRFAGTITAKIAEQMAGRNKRLPF